MNQPSHGGVRPGAGRKPTSERRVKRAVSLTVAADAVVLAQRQRGESYSAALERVLLAQTMPAPAAPVARTPLEQLLAVLCPERQRVAQLYRRLVQCGLNGMRVYALSALPLYVQANGFAIVRL